MVRLGVSVVNQEDRWGTQERDRVRVVTITPDPARWVCVTAASVQQVGFGSVVSGTLRRELREVNRHVVEINFWFKTCCNGVTTGDVLLADVGSRGPA